jgi:prophage regulatory protein
MLLKGLNAMSDDEDGFFSKKQVSLIVCLSCTHIARLEALGKFPRRLRLGKHRTSRSVYVRKEIRNWVLARIAERDKAQPQ